MKRPALLLAGLLCCSAGLTGVPPQRPRITGLDHVRIFANNVNGSREYYAKLYGIRPSGGGCFNKSGPCFTVGWIHQQAIMLEQAPPTGTKDLLAETAFATENVEMMREYLVSRGIAVSKINQEKYEGHKLEAHFTLRDPDGRPISFIQRFAFPIDDPTPADPSFVKIIHAGFVVRDRAATDHFYKDILGFRPYWHGGMKDNEDSWVAMQVPDGTDWVEYMLNIPLDADKKLLGVMNHIALGVTDIQATKAQLLKNGATLTEETKLGRDGKWQLNLYDPDLTRIEFMEFTPKEKPCCSEFTGPHPKP